MLWNLAHLPSYLGTERRLRIHAPLDATIHGVMMTRMPNPIQTLRPFAKDEGKQGANAGRVTGAGRALAAGGSGSFGFGCAGCGFGAGGCFGGCAGGCGFSFGAAGCGFGGTGFGCAFTAGGGWLGGWGFGFGGWALGCSFSLGCADFGAGCSLGAGLGAGCGLGKGTGFGAAFGGTVFGASRWLADATLRREPSMRLRIPLPGVGGVGGPCQDGSSPRKRKQRIHQLIPVTSQSQFSEGAGRMHHYIIWECDTIQAPGYAGFSPCLHLPAFHFGYLCLTQIHLSVWTSCCPLHMSVMNTTIHVSSCLKCDKVPLLLFFVALFQRDSQCPIDHPLLLAHLLGVETHVFWLSSK